MRFKRRWAIAITAAACVAAGPGLVSGPANVASAAPADIPWFERPVTVGTGFRLGTGATTATAQVVSASGRWVAFTSTAADLLPGSVGGGAFLRDRWTDTTTRLGAGVAGQLTPTRMSHDGNLIAGSGSDGSVDFSWIHDQRTRRTTKLVAEAAREPAEILGINNDGYFIARDGISAVGAPRLNRAGRILADGTLTPMSVTSKGSRQFDALTPSLQFAIATRDLGTAPWGAQGDTLRIDLTTGAMTSFADSFPGAEGRLGRIRSTAISPNGRYVAMVFQLPVGFAIRVWDAEANTYVDHQVPDGEDGRDPVVRAVLDDGRIVYDTVTNAVFFAAPVRHPEQAARRLTVKFDDGSAVRIRHDETFRASSQVATDIDRVLICPLDPMSSFAPSYQEHCYLKPFPPSPLAG